MQDAGVNEQDAESAEPSWYLSRDGEQLGPLTDRELSLFAEGGNFKPGDLLWTAGMDAWKPAEEIFDLAAFGEPEGTPDETDPEQKPAAETDSSDVDFLHDHGGIEDGITDDFGALSAKADKAALGGALPNPSGAATSLKPSAGTDSVAFEALDDDDAELYDHHPIDPGHEHLDGDHFDGDLIDGEHVGALAKAIRGETEPRKLTFQERMAAEFKNFAGLCGYLWAVFILLTLHAVVGGAVSGVGLSFFLLTTLNAFLLTQAMPQLERHFFQGLKASPLIYSIIYKVAVFVTLLFVAYIVEMAVLGLLTGGGLGAGISNLGGLIGTGVLWIIFYGALFPYVAFKEFENAVGADMIRKLLFGKA